MNNKPNKPVKMATVRFSEVPKEDRLQFFKDYYMWKLIIGLSCVAIIIYMASEIFSDKPNDILNIAIFEEAMDTANITVVENNILEALNVEGDNNSVTIDSNYYTDNNGVEKLQVYAVSGVVDLVIAPEEVFLNLAEHGYFIDVESFLGDKKGFYAKGFAEVEDGFGVAQGEEVCFGIYIGDSQFYQELGGKQETAVVGILANAVNKDNALEFLKNSDYWTK